MTFAAPTGVRTRVEPLTGSPSPMGRHPFLATTPRFTAVSLLWVIPASPASAHTESHWTTYGTDRNNRPVGGPFGRYCYGWHWDYLYDYDSEEYFVTDWHYDWYWPQRAPVYRTPYCNYHFGF